MNINCWEYCECGRQPGGHKVNLLGTCPASLDEKSDGINEGQNAGRYCWAIAGTMSGPKAKCSRTGKISSCFECDFFQLVKAQQQDSFVLQVVCQTDSLPDSAETTPLSP